MYLDILLPGPAIIIVVLQVIIGGAVCEVRRYSLSNVQILTRTSSQANREGFAGEQSRLAGKAGKKNSKKPVKVNKSRFVINSSNKLSKYQDFVSILPNFSISLIWNYIFDLSSAHIWGAKSKKDQNHPLTGNKKKECFGDLPGLEHSCSAIFSIMHTAKGEVQGSSRGGDYPKERPA